MVASALERPTLLPARPDLCLDYANTRYWRGTEPATEELRTFDDVLAWHGSKQIVAADAMAALAAWWRERPRQADGAFAEALALREALYRIFSATSQAAQPSETDLDALNRALARTPSRAHLRHTDTGYAWQVPRLRPAVTDLLAPVLWSAADLLTNSRLARVRRCANDKCLFLFVDDSRNGTRRWCSMSMCGNRAKAHRHYVKTKQA
ncbi:CGNR zinc finger domain-containing protein [Vineibacter terrae]|uniref:CGNR zinc finger domain-containing protein n=1 Tax=Vineibacter terrae TaxID=2586908 RepID=UPI002E3512B6|nr:ABATE domain-containing protein [Vineibacter terrae]HEX2890104.1 ABATE domain-containing protein [Vineibacter terrae]